MFTLEPTFTFPMQSETLIEHAEATRKILQKIIPEELFFEDKADFIDWIKEALPTVKWTECLEIPDTISIFLLCHSCKGLSIDSFFLDFLKKRLIPDREVIALSFQNMSFHLKEVTTSSFFVAEMKILIENSRDLHYVRKNLPLLAKEISLGVTSAPYAHYLLNSRTPSYSSKVTLIHQDLHQVMRKFPNHIDSLVFEELGKLLSMTDGSFINQRKPRHISRIACASSLIRKDLFRFRAISPGIRHLCLKLFRASLFFPFSSKAVLGLLVGINLMDKYELLDEEHVLGAVQKWIPQAQLVQGGSAALEGGKGEKIKLLYIELEKKDRTPFSVTELKLLNDFLKDELKHRIEKLVPAVFMIRNEEEVLRNILTLSREIHKIDDLPQVMISLDQQAVGEVSFTVILIWVRKKERKSLKSSFEKVSGNFFFRSDRVQTVGYLRKKHPIEAHVFSLSIEKNASLLRADSSLNFYVARQEVSSLLFKAIGEYRDYNGGIIVKQGEILSQFQQAFHDVAQSFPDLVENFFYRITPIEKQATLAVAWLNSLFDLFLSSLREELPKRSSYHIKSRQEGECLFLIIRAKDPSFKDSLTEAVEHGDFANKGLVSTSGSFQEAFYVGYILDGFKESVAFVSCIEEEMRKWHESIDALRVLRLSLQFSILSLDPRLVADDVSSSLLRLLFEGLMRYNRHGKVEYGIAEAVQISEDRKTYLFTLREAYWSNNTPVIAYNFEYAWKKILSPTFKTLFAQLFYTIKNAKAAKEGMVSLDEVGVRALDDRTLKVELDFPAPYFLELTTHTQFLPVNHHVDQLHPNWTLQGGDHFVCNGAFRLRTNNTVHGYELVKNPTYWESADVQIDHIILSRVTAARASHMFKKGEIDWVGHPFGSWDSTFEAEDGDKVIHSADVCAYWYIFNAQRFPFHNKKMRKAFTLAIDRCKVVKASPLVGEPAFSPLTKNVSLVEFDEKALKGDARLAVQLFEEALEELGLTRETFPVITLIFGKGFYRSSIATMMKEEWEHILGIQCNLESHEDWALAFNKITQGDFQIAGILWRSLINDPIYTLNYFRYAADASNFARWEAPEYQRVLDLADHDLDLEKRAQHLAEAEAVLIDEMPVLPIFYSHYSSLMKEHVSIDYSGPTGVVNHRWASLHRS